MILASFNFIWHKWEFPQYDEFLMFECQRHISRDPSTIITDYLKSIITITNIEKVIDVFWNVVPMREFEIKNVFDSLLLTGSIQNLSISRTQGLNLFSIKTFINSVMVKEHCNFKYSGQHILIDFTPLVILVSIGDLKLCVPYPL